MRRIDRFARPHRRRLGAFLLLSMAGRYWSCTGGPPRLLALDGRYAQLYRTPFEQPVAA